ncbi:hypothetical protein BDZ89DRAFT_1146329 [Hymenopellis radicata]|nr:hypothetical protein BDZ89DRAFT_1146329 [Hymenopellis radicata]
MICQQRSEKIWDDLQVETQKKHAEENPGYKYRPEKRRKAGTPTSSASPHALSPTTDEPQTPVWDTVPEGYQFTFAVSTVPSHSPSVASPQDFSPILYSSSPPANENEHVQSRDDFTLQAIVTASPEACALLQLPPDFYTQPSGNANVFDWQTVTTNTVAGPPTYQQYPQPYTPTTELPYTLNAFEGQAFVNLQDDVYSTTANQFPTDGSKWDLNQSPADLLLTLCRHRFQLEELSDINLDELESDDGLVTTMSPLDQELLALRREARTLFPPSLYEL